jgi:hypothetical protein
MAWHLIITWVILLLMGWSTFYLHRDQMTAAVLATPSLLVGVGYLSLNSGLNIYIDLVSSASHAVIFFTAWTFYLGWRVKFFADPQQQAKAFAHLRDRQQKEAFAVFEFKGKAMDLSQVFDALPADMSTACVLQMEALGQPKKNPQGLVYVLARHGDENTLLAQFKALQQSLKGHLSFAHISAVRIAQAQNADALQSLWTDVVQAKQQGSTS